MYHFIVNPVSRSGKGLRLWQRKIEPVLKKRNVSYSVDFSKQRGDVTKICSALSKKESDDENIIVILGGDGTLNDAVQGIDDFSKVILAYLPTGSSNDFARDLKISSSVGKSLKKILSSPVPREIDLGEVVTSIRHQKFVVSNGFGFDATVAQRTSHSRLKKALNKVGLGKLVYFAIAIKEVINAPKVDVTIEFDGERKVFLNKFLFLASMVHRYEGGGFKFCPKADCTDGLMDICYAHDKFSLGILMQLPSAFVGFHTIFHGIKAEKFKEARIMSSIPLWLHTDGEVWQKADDFVVHTYPQKMRMIL